MYNFTVTLSWIILLVIVMLYPKYSQNKRYMVLILLILLSKSIEVFGYISKGVIKTLMGDKEGYKYLARGVFVESLRFHHNFEALSKEHTIYLVNYPVTILEYALASVLPTPVCMVSSDRAKKLLSLAYEPDNYLVFDSSKKNNYEHLNELIRERIKKVSLYVYVDDMSKRISDDHVGTLRKGMFYIAKELGVNITPIAMDSIVTKGGIIVPQKFEVSVGETHKVEDPVKSMYEVRKFLLNEKKRFMNTKFESI